MKVILDTNVFVAGIFFTGPPCVILEAWRHGRVSLVVSPEIMEEYRRVVHELAVEFPDIDPGPPLELVAICAEFVDAPPLPVAACTDTSDDVFLACAVASGTKIVVSGDKALLRASGYNGLEVLTPRSFVDKHLK